MKTITTNDIWRARKRISGFIAATPIIYSASLSSRLGAEVYLKPECFQVAGSFKVRGACNKIALIKQGGLNLPLVTCSSGNHGTALAYAATRIGYPAPVVFVPEDADSTKVNRIRSYGAEVRARGGDFSETFRIAQDYVQNSGGQYVHSHSDNEIIAGQGTIGLELLEELPDLDAVVVPVGGGGLISGVATAVKAGAPQVEVFGVEAAAAPGAYLSFRDGRCHESITIQPSLADGLLGTLTPLTFSIAARLVSAIHTVEEAEIAAALKLLLEHEQIIAEGSSVVGLAAVLSGKLDLDGKKTVFILSGRNISKEKYLRAVTG
ncbi:MAG: threonine ammonia-lyase [Spirochaetota bacterium]